MTRSKSVGILLLLALGLTFAINSSAATNAPAAKSKVKKVTKKVVKKTAKIAAEKPVVKANSISNTENILKTEAAINKQTKENEKKWAIETHVDYVPETSKTFDSGLAYELDYYYKPSSYHTFRLYKDAKQIILPSAAPEKFVLGNTRLYYYYKFTGPETKDHAVGLRFLVTVGDSEQAKKDGLNSTESIRLEFSKMSGGFTLGLRPFFSHTWADYGTNAKGEPMPLFGVGHNLLLAYSFNDKWSLGTEIVTAFSFLQPEEVKRAQLQAEAQGQDASAVVDTTKTSFEAAIELGYQATKAFSMRLGYAQDDKLVSSEGKYGVNFMDNNSTRAYVGLDYTF